MRCETTSSVKECALRARSTHGVHHAIVEVNIVIGVVLGEVLVARVVPLVVDAVIGLALSLIAHVIVVVFVVAILHRIFLCGRYTLYRMWCATLRDPDQFLRRYTRWKRHLSAESFHCEHAIWSADRDVNYLTLSAPNSSASSTSVCRQPKPGFVFSYSWVGDWKSVMTGCNHLTQLQKPQVPLLYPIVCLQSRPTHWSGHRVRATP